MLLTLVNLLALASCLLCFCAVHVVLSEDLCVTMHEFEWC